MIEWLRLRMRQRTNLQVITTLMMIWSISKSNDVDPFHYEFVTSDHIRGRRQIVGQSLSKNVLERMRCAIRDNASGGTRSWLPAYLIIYMTNWRLSSSVRVSRSCSWTTKENWLAVGMDVTLKKAKYKHGPHRVQLSSLTFESPQWKLTKSGPSLSLYLQKRTTSHTQYGRDVITVVADAENQTDNSYPEGFGIR